MFTPVVKPAITASRIIISKPSLDTPSLTHKTTNEINCNRQATAIFLSLFNLNYSRNSIWTDNCTMNLKIDPCSHNITQLTRQKGIKSPWQSSDQLLSCQGSLIAAIPAVHSAYRYLKESHWIHPYKGSCYTAWIWYILLNELLLQQSSAVLNGRYQCAAFACLLITPGV